MAGERQSSIETFGAVSHDDAVRLLARRALEHAQQVRAEDQPSDQEPTLEQID